MAYNGKIADRVRKTSFILVGLFPLLIYSCRNKDNQSKIKNINILIPFVSGDTVINQNGVKVSDSLFTLMFFQGKIKENDFCIDSKTKLGIYANILLDKSRYFEASKILEIYPPAYYEKMSSGIDIPIFSDSLNEFLLLAQVKLNQFFNGYSRGEMDELYIRNFYFNKINDKKSRVRDYYKMDYLFNTLLRKVVQTNQIEIKILQELRNFETIYSSYSKIKYIGLFLDYITNNYHESFRKKILDYLAEDFQKEGILRILLELELNKEVRNDSLIRELGKFYYSAYNYCNSEYLKYKYLSNQIDSEYIKICWTCAGKSKNYDSIKSEIYLAYYYLEYKKYDSLDAIIRQHEDTVKKNSYYFNVIDTRRVEGDMYEVIKLQKYLRQQLYKDYVSYILNIRGNSIIGYSNDFFSKKNRLERVKEATFKIYLLNQEDRKKYDLYFSTNILNLL